MEKTHAVTKNGLVWHACLNAGLALAITIFGGAFGVVSVAGGAEGSAKGKPVEYITFGLQFEYQVAMVEGIKKKASIRMETGVKNCSSQPTSTKTWLMLSRKPSSTKGLFPSHRQIV